MTSATPGGTSPSSDSPRATRRRISEADTSIAGPATVVTRSPRPGKARSIVAESGAGCPGRDQVSDRIDRERRPAAIELNPARLEPRLTQDPGFDHREANLGRADRPAHLV